MNKVHTGSKRLFDLLLSLVLLPILIIPIIALILLATIDTKEWGIFSQNRIGKNGKPFKIFKIRTLKNEPHILGHLDKSATQLGKWIRRYKFDELPQLFNVLKGDMSFVGPRPDVKGFADELEGDDRIILRIRPGVTGPATIKYKNEEEILALQDDPEKYNRTIIWKDKVEINKKYIENWSFYLDLKYIINSIFK
ncbi:MAG: sugar transferase [Flavobacteriaceae bacterium]|nr:sugar transferase [Bacteroidia bacterium]NND11749.1 sugar transferase [Flavobacteriaceae bacterium]NNL60534.1 sugar transferase [Flavobacteriaceae bacterium]